MAAPATARPARKRNRKRKKRIPSSSSSSSSSEDDGSSHDSTSSAEEERTPALPPATPPPATPPAATPPAATLPSMPPDSLEAEQALKEKFRKFWMESLAEGFKDDLEQIRKASERPDAAGPCLAVVVAKQEPGLGPSRLAVLVESLAAGADVFSSSANDDQLNDMEVVADQLS